VSRTRHRWLRGDPGFPLRDADELDAMVGAGMPRVLLGEGDRADAFDAPCVAIVGTRAATPMGMADAREIAMFCARAGITVVSGLAIGIDAAAHEGALDAGGLTVGVVATGLDIVYPRRHERLYRRVREQGVIIGENAYGTQPLPWRFPIRNRIIAALGQATVVVEAGRTGGATITARHALEYGRDVYALPGSRRNPAAAGCNALIADGAKPLLDPGDVLFALGQGGTVPGGWLPPPKPPPDPDQRRILRVLGGDGATIDEIERRSGLPSARPRVRELVAGEARFALLHERQHRFRGVTRGEHQRLRDALELDRFRHRLTEAVVQLTLDHRELQRRHPREPSREHLNLRGQRVVRHNAVDETDAFGLVRVDDLGEERQLLGAMHPDEPWQEPRSTEVQHEVALREDLGEAGAVGRDDQVAAEREVATCAGSNAVHGGDRRDRQVVQSQCGATEQNASAAPVIRSTRSSRERATSSKFR
jgi:DNA protecting protein DprA